MSLVRDAEGGTSARELWRYEKSFFGVVPSPLVLDGLVYTIKNGGVLTILGVDTGEVVKTGRVGSAPASYSASPVATGGRIYFANEDGIVVVVRAGKDSEALAENDLGEPLFAGCERLLIAQHALGEMIHFGRELIDFGQVDL